MPVAKALSDSSIWRVSHRHELLLSGKMRPSIGDQLVEHLAVGFQPEVIGNGILQLIEQIQVFDVIAIDPAVANTQAIIPSRQHHVESLLLLIVSSRVFP
ncbi:MAG: hypothetical protein NTY41_16960 [Proteobacteria bacterium]|nr:hypothetical protein [Pseudomonadota bacterium]